MSYETVDLLLGAFNIRTFGKTKVSNEDVLAILVQVCTAIYTVSQKTHQL